jgi:SAM-dependent methyltransferase
MKTNCTVCKSEQNRPVFNENGIDVLRCRSCGHVFSSFDADQYYDQFWGTSSIENEDQPWWNDAHREMYGGFSKVFLEQRNGKILDVGCGLGYFVRHAGRAPGWSAYGCEISAHAVEFARNKLGLNNVFAGKLEDAPLPRGNFDIVTLWDVVEHIADPEPLLSRAFELLKDGGTLFLHTPNIDFQLPKAKLKKLLLGMRPDLNYIEARDHVNIYSMKTIGLVLRRLGYVSVEFIHLKPVQSLNGHNSRLLSLLKNAWFRSAALLHRASFGSVNLDNLFVIARKPNLATKSCLACKSPIETAATASILRN